MKVQAINNSPNFGAKIKINKEIPQGILADSLTTAYVPTDFLSEICMSDRPFHKLTRKYVKRLDEKSLLNRLLRKAYDKFDKKIPS